MRLLIAIILVALLPQVASARVFMCVDRETGKATFTDKGCDTPAAREEVRVDATNLESGRRAAESGAGKTWNSERDRRKTGRQYNLQYRQGYAARAGNGLATR
jgi:hypothetical protein